MRKSMDELLRATNARGGEPPPATNGGREQHGLAATTPSRARAAERGRRGDTKATAAATTEAKASMREQSHAQLARTKVA